VGRIFSQILDRGKPLWELWLIEGLEGDRVALVSKVHHCMVDGIAGAELISTLLTEEPTEKVDTPTEWTPRPAPSQIELGAAEVSRALRAPIAVGEALRRLARDEGHARHHLAERLRAFGQLVADGLDTPTPMPFNRPIGPYRRMDWTTMKLDQIREVRSATGATVNDVVLATASGAMGHFLKRNRGVDIDGARFRIMAPVSVRSRNEQGDLGNRVSAWNVDLPIAVPDPLAQLAEIQNQTRKLKESKRALGAETLTQGIEWTGSGILSLGARLMTMGSPFNMVITNVPGPRVPLYLLESRLLEIHPHVPLMGTLGLGLALFSYAGSFSWCYSADWDLVPDLHDLVRATQDAFEKLRRAAAGRRPA
jgi:WS/DGAT/MGAT family acyltransferase